MEINSDEFIKWLKKQGCKIIRNWPKGGHITVKNGNQRTVMPYYGSRQELKKGTVEAIKKQLGLNV